jgi:formyltetrahydrofolate deformylase
MEPRRTLIALLHGPDGPGLVARTSGWIYERGGNILHADQHSDREAGIFFQRIEWLPGSAPAPEEAEAFRSLAESLGMSVRMDVPGKRPRIAVFVSKADHCFHDLMLRQRAGEFAGEFVAVISNHGDLADAARGYGLPFHRIEVGAGHKPAAEAAQLEILRKAGADLAVLARYMQVLSSRFLADFARPVINIHHSFLPAFSGGRPYHQAYERGVKVIGATAHYATPDLDQGPIIHQDVVRVSHRQDVNDLIRLGRDLEKTVLAQALRWHLESRVLSYGNKTVVFD